MICTRGGYGTCQMGANGARGAGAQFQLRGRGAQYAAELRILLVYLNESLGRLGQNGGLLGATFFIGGAAANPGPP